MKQVKWVKKMAALLAGALLLTGCGAPAAEKGDVSDEKQEEVRQEEAKNLGIEIPEELPKYKIAVNYTDYSSAIGMQIQSYLESLSEDFNIEFVWIETNGMSSEAAQSALETALQNDIDGLLSVSASEAVLDAAKNAGDIPVAAFQFLPRNEETQQTLAAYENYLGSVASDDYQYGYQAAAALYEAGCRNTAAVGLSSGLSRSMDERMRGFKDGVAEHDGMEIIAEDLSRMEFAKAISAFAAAYPEMDGIFSVVGDASVYQAIQTEGLTSTVKLATVDVAEQVPDFLESGTLVYAAGGVNIMEAFALLYNYLYDGTKIVTDGGCLGITPIAIETLDEYETYMTYVEGDLPFYTPGEFAELVCGINPEMTPEKFVERMQDVSLKDVERRHKSILE